MIQKATDLRFNRRSYEGLGLKRNVTTTVRLWPGAAVAHTRRKRTLENSEIFRLSAYTLNGQFTLSAKSGRSLLRFK